MWNKTQHDSLKIFLWILTLVVPLACLLSTSIFRSLPCTLIDKSDTYPRRKSSNYSSSTFHGSRKGSMDSNGQVASFYDNDGFSGSEKDLTNSPVLMIKSKSSNRQVRSSLNRIQQQNDEIFELWCMFIFRSYKIYLYKLQLVIMYRSATCTLTSSFVEIRHNFT